ncbi:hypothetical protein AVEN_177139-1 [Araneus ventricosus]|uniref:Uncharacterized protein n=1 Tax=Araneus ventricosus TaxID=182803 RepID=A0A4Y2HPI9_ARAVE|nr:hypothetical protein AVEN_177139-1 [Araneus ventricosus]
MLGNYDNPMYSGHPPFRGKVLSLRVVAPKLDVHERSAPHHLERLPPKPVVNAKIRLLLARCGRTVWIFIRSRFPFGALGHRTELRSCVRGKRASLTKAKTTNGGEKLYRESGKRGMRSSPRGLK